MSMTVGQLDVHHYIKSIYIKSIYIKSIVVTFLWIDSRARIDR
jgi:hypothetical protein